jgi:putative Mn2+ efflux pump MntP
MIPWIALVLLLLIGGSMLKDGITDDSDQVSGNQSAPGYKLGIGALMMQGIATSIDALSVGFTISEYDLSQAICSALIIGLVTFAICVAGLRIGRRLGTVLAGKASILGGVILIAIGLEIWIKGVFF